MGRGYYQDKDGGYYQTDGDGSDATPAQDNSSDEGSDS